MRELFGGISRRERISLAREYEWLIRTVTAGENFTNEIPFTQGAAMAIICPSGLTATHVALYGSFESGGVPRPINDKNGTHLVVGLAGDTIVTLPADIFPVGFIFLGLASAADGTLTTEGANCDFVIMIKP